MVPQSPSKEAPWDLTVLPVTVSCPVIFSWISFMVWNLFPFKGDFSFGKSQKSQGAKSGLYGGWVTWVIWCFTKKLCMRQSFLHEGARCCNEAASHQLSIAVAFWIIWIVSVEECLTLMRNWMQIHCSAHLVILNVTGTQCIHLLNSVYHPHWLVQWSCHCSCIWIPVHSPWLPGYIDGEQIVPLY